MVETPQYRVVLTYWEASGEVSELSYKSLLYSTSVGSYCTMMMIMKYHEYNAADDDNNDYTSRDQMLLKTESLY